MILIVLPIFIRMRLPWRKKIPLILLFSLGLFTILAAILNKVYSFSQPYGSLWTFWYTRESSTALLVANLPFAFTLWLKIPGVRSLVGMSNDRTEKPIYGEDGTKLNGADDANEHSSGGSHKEHEIGEVDGDEVLADILRERNPASMSEKKEPTEFTHPHLFYSRKRSVIAEDSDADIEKAVLQDSPLKELERRT